MIMRLCMSQSRLCPVLFSARHGVAFICAGNYQLMDATNHKRTALVVSGKLSAWCHPDRYSAGVSKLLFVVEARPFSNWRLKRQWPRESRELANRPVSPGYIMGACRKQTPVDSLSDSHPDRPDLLCIEDFFNMHRLFGARPHSNTTPTHSRLRNWRWHRFCDFCLRFLSSMTSMISFQGGFFMAVLHNLKS